MARGFWAPLEPVITHIQQGDAGRAIQTVPEPLRGPLVAAIHSSFASTLDLLLVVSGALALAGAICSVSLIRSRDFVAHNPQPAPAPAPAEPVGLSRRPSTVT